jgi:hypothetical protein
MRRDACGRTAPDTDTGSRERRPGTGSAGEVLIENEWDAAGFAKSPISETNAAGLYELCGRSVMRMGAHCESRRRPDAVG